MNKQLPVYTEKNDLDCKIVYRVNTRSGSQCNNDWTMNNNVTIFVMLSNEFNVPCLRVHLLDHDRDNNSDCDLDHDPDNMYIKDFKLYCIWQK